MPAFLAHFLIAKDVFPSSGIPDTNKNLQYFLLGSVGPDLPYYSNVFGAALGTFFEEKFNSNSPGFYSGYGDFFHGRTPNVFPMKMLETTMKDKDPGTRDQKLAFTQGYHVNVASDHHIHPSVEDYAGPYYMSGTNRKKHRTFEVFEDILLYEIKTGKKFFDEAMRTTSIQYMHITHSISQSMHNGLRLGEHTATHRIRFNEVLKFSSV